MEKHLPAAVLNFVIFCARNRDNTLVDSISGGGVGKWNKEQKRRREGGGGGEDDR